MITYKDINNKSDETPKPIRILYSIIGIVLSLGVASIFWIFKEDVQSRATLSYVFLFLACLGSHASILIPSSATMIIMAAAAVLDPLLCGLIGGIGGALGEHTSYFCGLSGKVFTENSKIYKWLLPRFQKHDFLWVFLFSIVPLPVYDIAGLAAGVTNMKYKKFLSATMLGIVPKSILYALFGIILLGWVKIYFGHLPGEMPEVISRYLGELLTELGA